MHSSASQVVGIIDIELPMEACFGEDSSSASDLFEPRGSSQRLSASVYESRPGSVTIVADTEQLNRDLLEEVAQVRDRVTELRNRMKTR